MSTEKRIAKLKKMTKSDEPLVDPMNYRSSFIQLLNYYNIHFTKEQKKEWAVEYLKEEYPKKKIPNVSDTEFRYLGTLVRINSLDNYLEPEDLNKIKEECERILSLVSTEKEPTEVSEETTSRSEKIQETLDQKASEFIGEFEGLVDNFILEGTIPNIQSLIVSMDISSRVTPRIVDYAEKQKNYYNSVVNDKDALSYYSISKPNLKKIFSFYETLIEKISQSKKVRKQRVQKEKPAGVLVKSLKYQIKDETLNLRSKPPADIIGADEVYLYNTAKHRLFYFKALDGQKLTVKGTTIMNYDDNKSYSKNIRKPEVTLPKFDNKGKIDSRREMKDVVAKDNKVTGRTSDETIILSVFK